MTMLDSVLREKHLRRTQRLQELAVVRASCTASESALAVSRRLHDEARVLLWQTMTAAELCVQRLSIARVQETSACRAADAAAATHAANLQQLEESQRLLARIEKDIEKLQERWEVRRAAAVSELLKGEWRELDDWVVGRHAGDAR